jgi:cationic peptide transport system substrate-binding protein
VIKTFGSTVFSEKIKDYQYDSILTGWTADNADPDNLFRPLFSCAALLSGGNHVNWCNPEFDDFLNHGMESTNQKERRPYYQAAQKSLHQLVPIIPIAHALRFQAKSRNIGGISLNPYGGISFTKAYRRSQKIKSVLAPSNKSDSSLEVK